MRWAGRSLMFINAVPISDPTGSLPFFLFHPAFHPPMRASFLAGGGQSLARSRRPPPIFVMRLALVMPQIDVAPSNSRPKHPICPLFPLAGRLSRSLLLAVGAGRAGSTLSTARPRTPIWSSLDAKGTHSNLVEEWQRPSCETLTRRRRP